MRERVAVGDAALPAGQRDLFAHFVEVPARVAVAFAGRGRTVADDFDARQFQVAKRAAEFAAGVARLAGQELVPSGGQVDDRSSLVLALLAEQAGDAHRAGSAAAVGVVRADPAEVDHVPVAVVTAEVLHCAHQRGRWVRTDRAVPGAPIVERIGQYAYVSDAIFFGADAQRQDADRLASGPHDKHAKILAVTEVTPARFEPVEGVEEGGARRGSEERVPEQSVLSEVFEIVNLM